MSGDISIKAADEIVQEIDYTQEGIISYMQRNKRLMIINQDYYSHQHKPKEYTELKNIGDPFSRIIWNLYEEYETINSIAILRSYYSMLWATIGRAIPPLNAFHIEHFAGEIVCTERSPEPFSDFEKHQTKLIIQAIGNREILDSPAVLLRGFGVVVFGATIKETIQNIQYLEKVAEIAWKIYCGKDTLAYLDYSSQVFFRSLYCGSINYLNEKTESIGKYYNL